MNESDEALVLKSQKHDRAAFEELVRRTARLVYSRIYFAVGDAHRAEDLTQETLMTAWRSIGQMTDAAGFRPWLLSIARTEILQASRRNSRQKRTAPGFSAGPKRIDLQTLDMAIDPNPDPGQSAEFREEREQAMKLLQSVPAEYREPLMLRYIAGADYETISRQLGLSNGSLRGLLNRGMTWLRKEVARASSP